MNRRTVLSLAAIVYLFVAAALAAEPSAEKFTFKRQYVPGNYLTTLAMYMDQTTNVGEKEMKTQMRMLMEMSQRVEKLVGEDTKITIRYRRVKITSKNAEKILGEYDTAAPKQEGNVNPTGALYDRLIGVKSTVVVDAKGKVKEVSGLDKMWDDLGGPMAESMKKSMGDDMIRRMVEEQMGYLPANPVAVGESWGNYTLKAIEKADTGKRAVIDFSNETFLHPLTTTTTTTTATTTSPTGAKVVQTRRIIVNVDNPLLYDTTEDTTTRMKSATKRGVVVYFQTAKATTKTELMPASAPSTSTASAPAAE